MAHWNPHLLATKLCRVLDAELTTVDEIARISEVPPRVIEQIAKGGMKLSRDTELQISKAIGPLFHAHPELYKDPERTPKRGVFEDPHRFKGARLFTVVSSTGECLMRTEIKPEFATDAFEARLWRWLDATDPIPTLKVI
jgi:hypothetical protein